MDTIKINGVEVIKDKPNYSFSKVVKNHIWRVTVERGKEYEIKYFHGNFTSAFNRLKSYKLEPASVLEEDAKVYLISDNLIYQRGKKSGKRVVITIVPIMLY